MKIQSSTRYTIFRPTL